LSSAALSRSWPNGFSPRSDCRPEARHQQVWLPPSGRQREEAPGRRRSAYRCHRPPGHARRIAEVDAVVAQRARQRRAPKLNAEARKVGASGRISGTKNRAEVPAQRSLHHVDAIDRDMDNRRVTAHSRFPLDIYRCRPTVGGRRLGWWDRSTSRWAQAASWPHPRSPTPGTYQRAM